MLFWRDTGSVASPSMSRERRNLWHFWMNWRTCPQQSWRCTSDAVRSRRSRWWMPASLASSSGTRANAFVYFGFDDARARAREAEQALLSGSTLGVLHGIPTAMKDLFDFKPGWISTFGGI